MSESWQVYVLFSAERRTYVGITRDPEKRLEEHNGVRPGGAKATRAGRPWTLAALYGPYESRARAQQVEHAAKRKRGAARLDLPDEPRLVIPAGSSGAGRSSRAKKGSAAPSRSRAKKD